LVAEKLTEVSETPKRQLDEELIQLSSNLTKGNPHDLELIRNLLKKINDYRISLSSEEKTSELFQKAVNATNEDWVVCQQFSKYLLKRNEFEPSITWVNRALEQNPSSNSLQHQKGNILRYWGMNLKENEKDKEAKIKFDEARKFFTKSRMGSTPNEYGFVTHLDMLRYLSNNSTDDTEKANLIAEGANLYSIGVKVIPQYAYNVLLEARFNMFD
jgi:tetratricopeptide (TPR) repeat protein